MQRNLRSATRYRIDVTRYRARIASEPRIGIAHRAMPARCGAASQPFAAKRRRDALPGRIRHRAMRARCRIARLASLGAQTQNAAVRNAAPNAVSKRRKSAGLFSKRSQNAVRDAKRRFRNAGSQNAGKARDCPQNAAKTQIPNACLKTQVSKRMFGTQPKRRPCDAKKRPQAQANAESANADAQTQTRKHSVFADLS